MLFTLDEIDTAMCAVDDKTDMVDKPISAARWRAMVLDELSAGGGLRRAPGPDRSRPIDVARAGWRANSTLKG